MNLQNLIKYYNHCYQADNRGLIIRNFFSASVENRILFDGEDEIITGFMPYIPLIPDYAEKTSKKISLAEKEKELIYCSTFIVGRDDNYIGKSNKVCSPLFIYPAKIIQVNEEYFVEIDRENMRINFQLFSEIDAVNGDSSKFYESIFNTIKGNVIDSHTIGEIAKLIDDNTEDIDTINLLSFPTLFEEKTIKNLYKREKIKTAGNYIIVPAAGLAIVKKSINTRGIINELSEISNAAYFSEPLKTIFTDKKIIEMPNEETGQVPAILNSAQKSIIENSAKFPFSVINGPPGTGKTYTISALAIEKMSLGKSILIVSKTDKAVDIIAEKIENQLILPDVIIRAGRKQYKRKIVKYLSKILSNYYKNNDLLKPSKIKKALKKTNKEIEKLKNLFLERADDELKWGKFLSENKTGVFSDIKTKYINWRNNNLDNHFDIINNLQVKLNSRNDLILKYIKSKHDKNVQHAVANKREDINGLLKALKSITGTTQEKLFKSIDFKVVLKVFPIWLVKMSDIYKVLPLVPELFDYVIIDEATQCDIASSIPILQRGKRAVITGDPNQLRHFSFLSQAQQKIFRNKFDVNDFDENLTDYKNKSLLDAVSENAKSNNQFVFLNEHYRSLPSIIRFSNKNIYNSSLKIMTSRPNLTVNEGIKLEKCDGTRLKAGYNPEEAQKVLEIVEKIVSSEQNLKQNICSSIGILSPFRDQVEYISKQISQKFSLSDIKKHQISINTPYGFQGDERDIMILSFAVDNSSNHMAFRYLNKPEVFNVAITRARQLQYIVHSIDTKTLKSDSLLRQFIESFNLSDISENIKNQEFKDKFINEIKYELEQRNYKVWVGYNVAGLNIDLIISKNNENFGFDLIGYPGIFSEAFTLERYKMLDRAGLPTFPIAYSYWKVDKKACINQILQLGNPSIIQSDNPSI